MKLLIFLFFFIVFLNNSLSLENIFCEQSDKKRITEFIESDKLLQNKVQEWQKNKFIIIAKTILNKRLMMAPLLIDKLPVALGKSLGSKIIYFSQSGSKLLLLEDTSGKEITKEIPQQNILATFKIIEERADFLVFNFDEGMKSLYHVQNLHANDFNSQEPEFTEITSRITNSYIEKINAKANNFEITHIIQIITSKDEEHDKKGTYKVIYMFIPYQRNSNFQPKENQSKGKIGFFETTPLLEAASGRTTVKISKMDFSGPPVVYYIDNRTPEIFVSAVKDGINYWNRISKKVLGKEIFKIEILPKEKDRLSFDVNIIHWIDWRDADFAYADFVTNPFTGEILKSQIFLTSAFAINSAKSLNQSFEKLNKEGERENHNSERNLFTIKKFSPELICDFSPKEEFIGLIEKIISGNMEKQKILKIIQFYITKTVAHEVGHTLGLRHNFAGNLNANISFKEQFNLWKPFLGSLNLSPEIILTSSVMDYLNLQDSVMVGSQISAGSNLSYSYDVNAFDWGYTAKNINELNPPLFCSDGLNLKKFHVDCEKFDSGKEPFKNSILSLRERVQEFHFKLLARFKNAKNPEDSRDKKELTDLNISVAESDGINYGIEFFNKIILPLSKSARFFAINTKIKHQNLYEKEELEKIKGDYLKNILTDLNGYKNIFGLFFSDSDKTVGFKFDYLADSLKNFETLLKREELKNQFEPEELEFMKKFGSKYFSILNKTLVKAILLSLQGINPVAIYECKTGGNCEKYSNDNFSFEDSATKELQETLYNFANSVVSSESSRTIVESSENSDVKTITFNPTYDYPTRLLAINLLLNKKLFSDALFSENLFKSNLEKTKARLSANLNNLLKYKKNETGEVTSLNPEKFSEEARKYINSEKKLFKMVETGAISYLKIMKEIN